MVNEQEITNAYNNVIRATEKAIDSGIDLETEKEKLEEKVLKATFEGQIQGKNEGERKAVALQLFQQDYSNVDAKEHGYKVDQKELTLARLRLDLLRDCIRIEELAKK